MVWEVVQTIQGIDYVVDEVCGHNTNTELMAKRIGDLFGYRNYFQIYGDYSGQAGLYLSIHTADKCYYTLEDLEEATLAESNKEEQLPAGVKFHKFDYKVGCSYCRTLVKEYYTSPDAHICCKDCWEDIKGLTSEQRSHLLPGCRIVTGKQIGRAHV